MREIIMVHLAKTPYSIELDAKAELEKYLAAIEKNMHAEAEALQEIEGRMSELLAERGVMSGQVITLADVEMLRTQLGEPKEFLDDRGEGMSVPVDEPEAKTTKRLMRDPDSGVLGGVCAGMASYFNIDVLLVRLIAIALLVVSFGTFLFIYIVFWIITPPARSSADKLVMAGKPVTLEALRDSASTESELSGKPRLAARIARYTIGTLALLAAAGTLVGVLIGGIIGYQGISWMTDFLAQPWAYGMLASPFVGGVALVILLGLMAYAAFSWTIKRTVGVAALVMVLVGTLAVTGVAIGGIQASSALERDRESLTRVEKINLPAEISKTDTVNVVGTYSIHELSSDESPRAELRYWTLKDAPKPKVSVEKRDGTVWITVERVNSNQTCPVLLRSYVSPCMDMPSEVVLYGMESLGDETVAQPDNSAYRELY